VGGPLTAVAVFAVVAGVAMLGLWTMLLAARQVPEVAEGDREIWFHIGAEVVAAIMLVAGGVWLVASAGTAGARILAAAGLGAMLYSCIAGSGYYVKQGKAGPVVMFSVLAALAIAALVVLARASGA